MTDLLKDTVNPSCLATNSHYFQFFLADFARIVDNLMHFTRCWAGEILEHGGEIGVVPEAFEVN
jgi:hypothetical protein